MLSVEAGNGFQLVQRPAGVAETAAADHRDADSRHTFSRPMCDTGSGENRSDQQGSLVAYAAG